MRNATGSAGHATSFIFDPDRCARSICISDVFGALSVFALSHIHSRLVAETPTNYVSPGTGANMSPRAVHDLPVPILTDAELIAEYDYTFNSAFNDAPDQGAPSHQVTSVLRRNSDTMAELQRRGYRSASPRWQRSEIS